MKENVLNTFKAIHNHVPRSWVEKAWEEIEHVAHDLTKTEIFKKIYHLTHVEYPVELGNLLKQIA